MIPTTTMSSVRNADKALFFMTKKGCSNCEKVKPMVEKFEAENPDVLVFTHEAESPNDEMLKEFPPIKMFPGVFCLKAGKLVSLTNAIPPYESFSVGLMPIGDKYAHFGKITRTLAQLETELKNAKEFHQFLDQSITMEEAQVEPEFLPPVQPAPPEEECTSCQ
jgi:thiol-disulfide isomerase/thioredoxin